MQMWLSRARRCQGNRVSQRRMPSQKRMCLMVHVWGNGNLGDSSGLGSKSHSQQGREKQVHNRTLLYILEVRSVQLVDWAPTQ